MGFSTPEVWSMPKAWTDSVAKVASVTSGCPFPELTDPRKENQRWGSLGRKVSSSGPNPQAPGYLHCQQWPGSQVCQEGETSSSSGTAPQPGPSSLHSHPSCRRYMSAREFWFDVAGLLLFS